MRATTLATRVKKLKHFDGDPSNHTPSPAPVAGGKIVERRRRISCACALIGSGLLGIMPSATAQPREGWQADWRFCGKCHQLFFDGYANDKGTCSGGGVHSAIGINFRIYTNVYADELRHPNIQYRWRYCENCNGMVWQEQQGRPCPGGGAHYIIGWKFGLHHDLADSTGQTNWRYCGKCASLFYNGYAHKGRCAAGGQHHAPPHSFDFRLYPKEAAAVVPPAQNPPAAMARPQISVTLASAQAFLLVRGSGFLAGSTVTIRVADANLNANLYFSTVASPHGTISTELRFPCRPGILYFSATDGRKDPADFTGSLWSNTVSTACP